MEAISTHIQPFLSHLLKGRGLSPATVAAYEFDLTKFITFLNNREILIPEDVTCNAVADYLEALQVASPTKARIRSSIKSFFKYLSTRGIIPTDPTAILDSIKLPIKRSPYLRKDEWDLLLMAVKTNGTPSFRLRDLTLIQLLIMSGLRRGEVTKLKLRDVDLNHGVIAITRKGGTESVIPIHQELAVTLAAYISSSSRHTSEPLFLSKLGRPLSDSSVWHIVKRYCSLANLDPKITVHSLRHSFASHLLDQGVALPYIQGLLGHRSPSTTSRYLHFNQRQLATVLIGVTF